MKVVLPTEVGSKRGHLEAAEKTLNQNFRSLEGARRVGLLAEEEVTGTNPLVGEGKT
jgi:hypothetical protein